MAGGGSAWSVRGGAGGRAALAEPAAPTRPAPGCRASRRGRGQRAGGEGKAAPRRFTNPTAGHRAGFVKRHLNGGGVEDGEHGGDGVRQVVDPEPPARVRRDRRQRLPFRRGAREARGWQGARSVTRLSLSSAEGRERTRGAVAPCMRVGPRRRGRTPGGRRGAAWRWRLPPARAAPAPPAPRARSLPAPAGGGSALYKHHGSSFTKTEAA